MLLIQLLCFGCGCTALLTPFILHLRYNLADLGPRTSVCTLQGTGDVAPRALGIRNTNAPAGKPPVAATKGAAGKRGVQGTGAKVKGSSSSSSASLNSGPADDDDAGLAAGTLSKAEAEEKMLGLFGEGKELYGAASIVCNLSQPQERPGKYQTVVHRSIDSDLPRQQLHIRGDKPSVRAAIRLACRCGCVMVGLWLAADAFPCVLGLGYDMQLHLISMVHRHPQWSPE